MTDQPKFVNLESFTWNTEEEYIIKKSIRNLDSPIIEHNEDARRRLKKIGKKCLPYIIEAIENNALTPDCISYELPEVFALFKKNAVSFLIPYLDNPNEDLVDAAISAITEVGKPAVPILCEEIDTENIVIRQKIIEILGSIGDKKALPVLIETLSDPEESVRSEAEWALEQFDSSIYDQILPLLNSDSIHQICSAIYILPRLDRDKGISAVIPLLKNTDEEIFDSLFRSFSFLKPIPVDELLTYVHSENTQELCVVLNILANCEDTSVIEKISHLKDHPDDGVRETAEWAIDMLTESRDKTPLII